MSTPTASNEGGEFVLDEENIVDKKRKEMILSRRQEVDEREDELFSAVKVGKLTYEQAATLWHDSVRRYLTSFEPLLRNERIPQSSHYYHDIHLGEVEIAPPERFQVSDDRPQRGCSGRRGILGEDAPKTVEQTIRGLKTVIETEQFSKEWSFRVNLSKTGAFPQSGHPVQEVSCEETVPMPRGVLMNAVRGGDEFLENAGIGVETGAKEVDVQADPF